MNFLIIAVLAAATISIESKKYNVNKRSDFVRLLSKCYRGLPDFDDCILDGLNSVRPYFKYGVPEFGIPPFDPFYVKEVTQIRGGPNFNYKLTLRNVYESGWTDSYVYRFKSDLTRGYIRYHQLFPAKFLVGKWQIESQLMGPYANSGTFNLSLYNYTQVTTVQANKGTYEDSWEPFDVRIRAIDSGDMTIHVSNLIKGVSPTVDSFLDRLINFGWRPGFTLLKPLIDDLVSKAFTKIFNEAFRNFPFDEIFKY